jgi:hypothetical protein
MAQVDQAFFFTQTAEVEVHVAAGTNPNNNPADTTGSFVDPGAYGTLPNGNPVVPILKTVAGVRFSNPA